MRFSVQKGGEGEERARRRLLAPGTGIKGKDRSPAWHQ
jgi:hypothetical protein